jgi:hypothetical protein
VVDDAASVLIMKKQGLLQQLKKISHMLGLTVLLKHCQTLEREKHDRMIAEMEERHCAGYRQQPVEAGEFAIWEC